MTKLAHLRKDMQSSSHMNSCLCQCSSAFPAPLHSPHHSVGPFSWGAAPETQNPLLKGFLLPGLASPPGTFSPMPAAESSKSLSSGHLGRCFLASEAGCLVRGVGASKDSQNAGRAASLELSLMHHLSLEFIDETVVRAALCGHKHGIQVNMCQKLILNSSRGFVCLGELECGSLKDNNLRIPHCCPQCAGRGEKLSTGRRQVPPGG